MAHSRSSIARGSGSAARALFHSAGQILISAVLLLVAVSTNVRSQQHAGGVSITQHQHDILSITSRDYWVAFPGNYGGENDGGKYIMLYISSVDSTTAYIEVNGEIDTVSVVPGMPVAYSVPLIWEMLSSDVIENKAVHVWSNDVALFVDFNSHDAYTSDASYIIPSAGWGDSYVVAAYESLNESLANGFGGYAYDYPSEFVVVANQDSTNVTITPSFALRSTRGDSSTVYPMGVPFTITMNAGQAVQYEAVPLTDTTTIPFDVTGTQIVSSNPVGVIGATSCANIPVKYPYCDFACEMIPPTRTWGQTYYTAPLYGRVGGDTYLVIGTQPNQVITRTDTTGSVVFATLTNPNDHYWRHDVATPSSWTSDAPFLLIQYSNSSTWPNGENGNYDPFMMAVNSVDHFSTPVIFNVLHNGVDQSPYYWHADIVARSGVPVMVDGAPISVAPMYDDGFCAVYQLDSLEYRQYLASSDSGVSVSVYGDGFDEAVGYSGMIGVSTTGSADYIAPDVVANQVTDTKTTFIATKAPSVTSGLSEIEVDTISNMQIKQAPNFVDGSGSGTGSFDLVVVDPTKSAHATVRVLDLAGNYTTVVKDYVGSAASVATALDAAATAVAPNPAKQDFTIRYSLAADCYVSGDLFDELGNRVLHLINMNQTAGSQLLLVDTHLLPNGTYIYRLDLGGVVQSGKVVVSR